jgi:PST family polysaccharide transporter
LALVAIVQSIENVDWWIYFSQARTDIMFRWGIVTTTAYVISFVVGVRSGVIGVAIAYAIAVFLLAYPSFAIPFKLIDLKIKDFFAPLTSVTLATLASGIVGFSVRFFFEELAGVPNVIVLVVVVVTGLASYLGLLFVLDRNLFTTAFHLISEFLHPPISPTEDQVD